MGKLVGNRYAISLFDAGLELDKIEEFYKEINFIGHVLNREKRLLEVLVHPRISKSEKKEIIDNIFKDKISQEIKNFFYIIIDKRREDNLLSIVDEFNLKYDEYKNIVNVEATTAIKMEDKSREKLISSLEKKMNKTIILTNKIDPSIIGGVKLRLNDKFIDNTLKTQLGNMETHIKQASL